MLLCCVLCRGGGGACYASLRRKLQEEISLIEEFEHNLTLNVETLDNEISQTMAQLLEAEEQYRYKDTIRTYIITTYYALCP